VSSPISATFLRSRRLLLTSGAGLCASEKKGPRIGLELRTHWLTLSLVPSKKTAPVSSSKAEPVGATGVDWTARRAGAARHAGRLEILRLSGYSEEEKVEIAKRYLAPRQRQQSGLTAEQLNYPDETLKRIISRYTREAGVRLLEKAIGRVARKIAVRFAEGKGEPVTVRPGDLTNLLGSERVSALFAGSNRIRSAIALSLARQGLCSSRHSTS